MPPDANESQDTPPVLRLHNTLTRSVEAFTPADPSRVTFYSCGPTVYDDSHIGNFRSFLAADLLRRWIESPLCALATDDGAVHRGPREVVHVMNITDVGHMTDDDVADGGGEDKMAVAGRRITEAKKSGKLPAGVDVDPKDPRAIAAFYAGRFIEDAKALGMQLALDAETDPRRIPFASAYVVEGMIPLIESLIEKGYAYAAGEEGSRAVYFDVQQFDDYGRLSGNTLDALRGGAGGRVSDQNQQEKRHPADFLLWKQDASHLMKWDSPWGAGYPGWHIECSAMARAVLGDEIDLHSGGEDNIFPHHECEIAQSRGATGRERFARHWFHPRFLMVEGKKMSKSAGTFYTARDLFEQGHEPAAVRLALIGTHYRANLDFSMDLLDAVSKRIRRLRRITKRLTFARDRLPEGLKLITKTPSQDIAREFANAMSNDLNIAQALSIADKLVSATVYDDSDATEPGVLAQFTVESDKIDLPEAPMELAAAAQLLKSTDLVENRLGLLHLIDSVLGVVFVGREKGASFEIGVFLPGVEPSAAVEALLIERRDAKKAKEFARADAIRDELAAQGYAIKDVAGGQVEVGPA